MRGQLHTDGSQAPGEAEAELAYLNQFGTIDAVLTDDGDALLFGALCVVRNPNIKVDGDTVRVYSANSVELSDGVMLTRGSMILIALLSGGDYDTNGLEGCGAVTAHQLTHTGLGDTLLTAALTLSMLDFVAFLAQWRMSLRHQLTNDPARVLGRKHPSLAASIPDTFPNPATVLAYTSPNTSWSQGGGGHNLPFNLASDINLARLAELCTDLFGWTPIEVLGHFRNTIYSGTTLRMLYENYPVIGAVQRDLTRPLATFTASAILEILRKKITPSGLTLYYIKVSTAVLTTEVNKVLFPTVRTTAEANEQLDGSNNSEGTTSTSNATFDRCWVPSVFLAQALPAMAQDFETKRTRPRRQGTAKVTVASASMKPTAIAGSSSGIQTKRSRRKPEIPLSTHVDPNTRLLLASNPAHTEITALPSLSDHPIHIDIDDLTLARKSPVSKSKLQQTQVVIDLTGDSD